MDTMIEMDPGRQLILEDSTKNSTDGYGWAHASCKHDIQVEDSYL